MKQSAIHFEEDDIEDDAKQEAGKKNNNLISRHYNVAIDRNNM